MAVTTSRTITRTFARSELIKWQVLTALRRTVTLREENKVRISHGLDRQWIKAVHIYALNAEGECSGELRLEIDWKEYQIQVYRGKGVVTIDDNWVERTTLEVDEAISVFNEWVHANKLVTKYVLETPTPEEGVELINFLGFIPTTEPEWVGDKHGTTLNNRDLTELAVGCYFADEER